VFIAYSDYGHAKAQTVVGATCSLRAVMPDGRDAAGVENPKVTDGGGYVDWTYPEAGVTYIGTGMHIVSCSYNGLSGFAMFKFEVGA
jgi:hypothetical protein